MEQGRGAEYYRGLLRLDYVETRNDGRIRINEMVLPNQLDSPANLSSDALIQSEGKLDQGNRGMT